MPSYTVDFFLGEAIILYPVTLYISFPARPLYNAQLHCTFLSRRGHYIMPSYTVDFFPGEAIILYPVTRPLYISR